MRMLLVYKKGKIAMSVGTHNEANRIEWVKKTLAEIPKGSRILDAGAGEQQFKKFCSHLEYVAQDFGQYEGTGDGRGLQPGSWDQTKLDIVCDITNISEPDGSFDAIMCTEVFEHLSDPIAAVQEFFRLLRRGGVLIITAPFCSLTHFSPYHFYSGFNRYFYQNQLEKNGFEILELESNGNFFEYLGQEIHRIPRIAKEYAGDHPNRLERYSLRFILKMLERFSSKDQGSDELLCFGYHVLARKRDE
jgi:ubiquinone/menaquinone biosynthesis C-methylase UbiE